MMPTPHILLVALAVVLLFLATIGVPGGRFSLLAGGLLAWLLSTLA